MKIFGMDYRTIWVNKSNEKVIQIIDQRFLPHQLIIEDLYCVADMAAAIREMHIRGAGLIGASAGYGMYLAALEAAEKCGEDATNFMSLINESAEKLIRTRPTAINLEWAVKRMLEAICNAGSMDAKLKAARQTADDIADEDADFCRRIGQHGYEIIREISERKLSSERKPGAVRRSGDKDGVVVNILTHCNAGWLAFVDYGTATAPIYEAHRRGIKVHVYVDETRPRNQGSQLTAFELEQNGVPHTIIADNTGGHLMQHGMVDMVITGSDRTTFTGDVANKIGTYLKALAAYDNNVPFYVALPSSTIDWTTTDGINEIPIEERGGDEIRYFTGPDETDTFRKILIANKNSPVLNYGFDVTPARLVTALITENGICPANEDGIKKLFGKT